MGGGVTKDGDFKIGLSAVCRFKAAECGGYSDWFVTAAFNGGAASLKTSFGHGSPFVYCTYAGGDPVLALAPCRRGSGRERRRMRFWGSPSGAITTGCSGPTGSTWSGLDSAVLTNAAPGKPYLSVALLPDDKPETLDLFKRYAYNHVTDTRVDYQVIPGKVKATYSFKTKAMGRLGKRHDLLALSAPVEIHLRQADGHDLQLGARRDEGRAGRGIRHRSAGPGSACRCSRRKASRTRSACSAT